MPARGPCVWTPRVPRAAAAAAAAAAAQCAAAALRRRAEHGTRVADRPWRGLCPHDDAHTSFEEPRRPPDNRRLRLRQADRNRRRCVPPWDQRRAGASGRARGGARPALRAAPAAPSAGGGGPCAARASRDGPAARAAGGRAGGRGGAERRAAAVPLHARGGARVRARASCALRVGGALRGRGRPPGPRAALRSDAAQRVGSQSKWTSTSTTSKSNAPRAHAPRAS